MPYKDILEFQLNLINETFETEFSVMEIINIEEVSEKIKTFEKNLYYGENLYYSKKDDFQNIIKGINQSIENNKVVILNKLNGLFFKKEFNEKIFNLQKENSFKFLFLNLNLIKPKVKINEFDIDNLPNEKNEELNNILIKIKKLNELDFFTSAYSGLIYDYFNYEFFNVVKNKLYNENKIKDYVFFYPDIINLIELKISEKDTIFNIDSFFISNYDGKNKRLIKLQKYIEDKLKLNINSLSIYYNFNKSELEKFLSKYPLILLNKSNYVDFNYVTLLYLFSRLDIDYLINYFNKLPQEYKNVFNEELVSKFDKNNQVNVFRKLQLNNKLNNTFSNSNKKEKVNKI